MRRAPERAMLVLIAYKFVGCDLSSVHTCILVEAVNFVHTHEGVVLLVYR